jgi:hypothetical protein
MPSHISRVEPLRPEWPSWRPIFAVLRSWTKSVTRVHASRCVSFHRPVQPGVMRPSGETQTISVMTRPAPPSALEPRWTTWKSSGTPSTAEYMSIGETMIRFFSSRPPMVNGWNIAGTDSVRPWASAKPRSIRSAKPGSRSLRLSKVIRRDRVSRLKQNCAGSWSAYMPMFSNHSSEACAARWVDSTTGGARSRTPSTPRPRWGVRADTRRARGRPPWPAWCRSRSRSARCGRRRRAGPRCGGASARCGPS